MCLAEGLEDDLDAHLVRVRGRTRVRGRVRDRVRVKDRVRVRVRAGSGLGLGLGFRVRVSDLVDAREEPRALVEDVLDRGALLVDQTGELGDAARPVAQGFGLGVGVRVGVRVGSGAGEQG